MAGRKPKPKGYGNGGIYPDSERPGHSIVKVPFPDGRIRKRRASSAEAAEKAYQELLAERNSGLNTDAHSITLTAFVQVWWDKAIEPKIASGKIAPMTQRDYLNTLQRYALPDWGERKLKEFDAPLIIDIFYAVLDEYSEAMAHRVLTKLHMVFDAARRWKYLKDNPVADARKDLPPLEREERTPLTMAEAWRLRETVRGHRLELAYDALLLFGTRIGETFGLQWVDVDWEHQTIAIRRQAQDGDGGAQVRNTTKSRAGKRLIPMPPTFAMRLRELYDAQPRSIFIFPNDEGRMLSPGGFTRHFRGGRTGRKNADGSDNAITGMRQKAGLPSYVTPHTFRHTLSTRLKEMGVSEEIRADILGHGKRTITQHYSHRVLEPMRRALTEWEEALLTEGKERVKSG